MLGPYHNKKMYFPTEIYLKMIITKDKWQLLVIKIS